MRPSADLPTGSHLYIQGTSGRKHVDVNVTFANEMEIKVIVVSILRRCIAISGTRVCSRASNVVKGARGGARECAQR